MASFSSGTDRSLGSPEGERLSMRVTLLITLRISLTAAAYRAALQRHM
jgi:hypothetical protein